LPDLEWRSVVEPAARVVVVAVDVTADPALRVVERVARVQQYLPYFEFPGPAFDEGLRLERPRALWRLRPGPR
jgi:hypothetical protein